jgi:hypothetical protein
MRYCQIQSRAVVYVPGFRDNGSFLDSELAVKGGTMSMAGAFTFVGLTTWSLRALFRLEPFTTLVDRALFRGISHQDPGSTPSQPFTRMPRFYSKHSFFETRDGKNYSNPSSMRRPVMSVGGFSRLQFYIRQIVNTCRAHPVVMWFNHLETLLSYQPNLNVRSTKSKTVSLAVKCILMTV